MMKMQFDFRESSSCGCECLTSNLDFNFSCDCYVLTANLFLLQSVFFCQVFPRVPGIVNTVKICLRKKDSLRLMPML